jgi:hypothetical protein
MDVFYIDGTAHLICVAKPLDLLISVDIADSRSFDGATLSRCVNEACAVLTDRGFSVERIYADGEFEIKGVKIAAPLDICGAGDHVAIAERAIRTVEQLYAALYPTG